jgi:hypothetical protein
MHNHLVPEQPSRGGVRAVWKATSYFFSFMEAISAIVLPSSAVPFARLVGAK